MLVRARVVSFLSGFAVAGCICLYQLRQDIWESHKLLASQVGRPSVQPHVSPTSAEEAVFGRLGSVERFVVVIIVFECTMDATWSLSAAVKPGEVPVLTNSSVLQPGPLSQELESRVSALEEEFARLHKAQ